MNKLLFIIIIMVALQSCSQKRRAEIVMKNDRHYNQHNFHKKNGSESNNVIFIAAGDNIYNLSKKYKVPMRDLIDKNNLKPPYNLTIGGKIYLPSAKYHQVKFGETLYLISRNYDLNINDLIALNNLTKPYNIKVGDQIRITNIAESDIRNERSERSERNVISTKKKIESVFDSNINKHFIWPVKGKIISAFGAKAGGLYNDGINIKSSKGTPVKASEDGVAAYVGNELRGYGNLIIIKHSGNFISAYAHLDQTKIMRGHKVKKGDVIATIGTSGNVSTAQLYFGIRKGREAVNPRLYLK